MKTFFTSDTHFGHANIIKYCQRPFESVDEMNLVLTQKWNAVVGDKDIVYHLGDVTLGDDALSFLTNLNGKIRVLGVPWHHDARWLKKTEADHLEILGPEHVFKHQGHWLHLSHYPMGAWDRRHYGALNLHGHSHGEWAPFPNQIDVGVDCWNFTPVTLEQILARFPASEVRPE